MARHSLCTDLHRSSAQHSWIWNQHRRSLAGSTAGSLESLPGLGKALPRSVDRPAMEASCSSFSYLLWACRLCSLWSFGLRNGGICKGLERGASSNKAKRPLARGVEISFETWVHGFFFLFKISIGLCKITKLRRFWVCPTTLGFNWPYWPIPTQGAAGRLATCKELQEVTYGESRCRKHRALQREKGWV